MPYFGISVLITCEKSSGASFLGKSMKKLNGYTKPKKFIGPSQLFLF